MYQKLLTFTTVFTVICSLISTDLKPAQASFGSAIGHGVRNLNSDDPQNANEGLVLLGFGILGLAVAASQKR